MTKSTLEYRITSIDAIDEFGAVGDETLKPKPPTDEPGWELKGVAFGNGRLYFTWVRRRLT